MYVYGRQVMGGAHRVRLIGVSILGGHTGRKYLSTPSAVKYHSKRRADFRVVNTVANVDGYAW